MTQTAPAHLKVSHFTNREKASWAEQTKQILKKKEKTDDKESKYDEEKKN